MPRPRRREQTEEEKRIQREENRQKSISDWVPKTEAGKLVRAEEIKTLDELFAKGHKVLEPEIVSILVPDLMEKMVDFKKTTKVTRQGRNFTFRAAVLIGDGNSYIGLGTAKDKEKFPAINKATRNAKLALKKVRKGCGSWECRCKESHSVPFTVTGKSASVRVTFMPAPKGTGLVTGDSIKSVLMFTGIKDVWSRTQGNTGSTLDFVAAAIDALNSTNNVRLSEEMASKIGEKK